MVSKLNDLADLLQNDALSPELTRKLMEKQQEIAVSLENGRSLSITGPKGEVITITPSGTNGRR